MSEVPDRSIVLSIIIVAFEADSTTAKTSPEMPKRPTQYVFISEGRVIPIGIIPYINPGCQVRQTQVFLSFVLSLDVIHEGSVIRMSLQLRSVFEVSLLEAAYL